MTPDSALPNRRDLAFLTPLFLFMVVVFDLPILVMLGWSVSNPGVTLRHYATVFQVPVYLKVLGNTARIALVTTIVSVALGYPLAYWLRGRRGGRGSSVCRSSFCRSGSRS
jgi:ABC-type spermidine/putrescine transport system permease subunit I